MGELTRGSYPEFGYVGEAGHYMVFADDADLSDVFSDGPGRWFVWPGGGEPHPTREAAARAAWDARHG